MKFSATLLSVLAGATLLSAPGVAEDMRTPPRCFSITQFENWKAPDAKTIFIRVNLHDYYRLDLSAPCQGLMLPSSHLITKTRGPDQVCSGVDWDLAVSDSSGPMSGGFREACIVKTQTPLSPADVAAIPKKFKP